MFIHAIDKAVVLMDCFVENLTEEAEMVVVYHEGTTVDLNSSHVLRKQKHVYTLTAHNYSICTT